MIHFITRIASLVLAFGFFIGCSILPSLSNSDDNAPADTEESLTQQLKELNQVIEETSGSAETYYRKGEVLGELAHKKSDPEDRSHYYRDMNHSLSQADSLYMQLKNPAGREKLDELLKVNWSYEHNRGVEILQADSTLDSNDFELAAAHFNNAIIIIPDSVVSYKMKARAHYRNDRIDQAITTLERAYQQINPLSSDALEQLAFLYLESDQPQKAIDLYEQAESFSGENLNLIHGLTNAYITAGRHTKAIDLLEELVKSEPENVIYRETLGTELYNIGIKKMDSLIVSIPEDSLVFMQRFSNADTLLARAEKELNEAVKLNPEGTELKQRLASLYQNYAAHLKKINQHEGLPMPEERIENKIEENLTNAIALFEELVDEHPDKTTYWKNLYQAYSYLGMQQKAEEAKAKANL